MLLNMRSLMLTLCVGASGCTQLQALGGIATAAAVVLAVYLVLAFVAHIRHLAIVLALASFPARAQHVGPLYALAGDVLLVSPPAPVDDPGTESGATLAPEPRASVADPARRVLVADAGPPAATRPVTSSAPSSAAGVAAEAVTGSLPAPVVADCAACARDLVPASKWPWWGTLLISIAASGAAVADHWLTRVAP